MDPTRLASPHARFGLWLPLGSVAAFGVLGWTDLLRFSTAVMAVTLPTALAWVAVGFGGDRVGSPLFRGRPGPAADGEPPPDPAGGGLDGTTALVLYLSVTTALGWAVLLAVRP